MEAETFDETFDWPVELIERIALEDREAYGLLRRTNRHNRDILSSSSGRVIQRHSLAKAKMLVIDPNDLDDYKFIYNDHDEESLDDMITSDVRRMSDLFNDNEVVIKKYISQIGFKFEKAGDFVKIYGLFDENDDDGLTEHINYYFDGKSCFFHYPTTIPIDFRVGKYTRFNPEYWSFQEPGLEPNQYNNLTISSIYIDDTVYSNLATMNFKNTDFSVMLVLFIEWISC